ncbi:MAG: TonB-dependent receptor [Chitinophagaceae bacterium]
MKFKFTRFKTSVPFLLFVLLSLNVYSQKQSVKGIIKNEKGEALAGATVSAQSTRLKFSQTAQTNDAGQFTFSGLKPGGPYTFNVSYAGYTNKSLAGYFYKEGDVIDLPVVMELLSNAMNEVVVVGYGTQKKVNLTGAVDQIGSEYFENRPMTNVARGLEGTIPNLNIKMTDGKPTRGAVYNIRGATSIGSGGSALILIDGVPGDPNTLNPNDIESISVLKDAASAAIYGARGSFGVVLITTRTPKRNKIQVSYNGSYSINKRTVVQDFVSNGYEWAKNFDESFYGFYDYISHPQTINTQLPFSLAYLDSLKVHDQNPNLPSYSIDPVTGKYLYYSNTDWFKELYNDQNPSMEHSINVSGGSEKVNYMISGRYFSQDGIYRYNTDNFHRYNFRFKGSVKVNSWLTISNNSDFSTYDYKYPLTSVGGVNALLRLMAVTAFPVSPLLNPDKTMTIVGAYSVGDLYYGKSYSTAKQNFLRNTLGFTASVLKNKLNIKGDFSYLYTNTNEQRKFFTVPYSTKPDELITTGLNYLNNKGITENYYVGNLYGEYTEKLGNHNIKVLGGWNVEYDQIKNLFVQRDGLLLDNLPDFNLATGLNYRVTGGGSEWATAGAFYRVNYDFKDKYLLELNGRYDGSSKFPENQRFGFFPSASAGWKISEENFLKKASWIDNMKIRGSYGSLGNGNIAPYTFLQTLGASTSSVIMNGIYPSYIAQPAVIPSGLTWEKSTMLDFGVDVQVLNRRLSGTFDWYERKTTNMITSGQPLPSVFGASVPRGNFADLKTKGWEISITWMDEIKWTKPLSYSLRVTLADNVGYITKFYNPNKLLSTYYEGQKLGNIWGFETEGFFESKEDIAKHANQNYFVVSNNNQPLPGDLKFKDINGDGKVNIGKNTLDDPGDQKVIGNSAIRYTYGITGNVDWNNFSLSAFFQGIGKRDWYPSTEASFFWGQYNRPYSFLPAFTLNHWTEDNPSQSAYFPRYRTYTALSGTRQLAVAQTRYLQNASYIRLKNLTVGYSLPKKTLEKMTLTAFRIYFTGQNLWTYTPMFKVTKNFDPEVIEGSDAEINANQGDGFSYPMQKSYTLGINVTF